MGLSINSLEKPLEKFCSNYRNDKTKFIAGVAVSSIVLKDGLGCYLYVKQSLNNKKIPDDKRKFVAALDLTNGGLMIAAQLLMYFTVSSKKVQEKMFNSWFGKYFDRAVSKGCKEFLELKGKAMSPAVFNKTFKDLKEGVKGSFGFLTSLLAATIVAKRMIVPFIATPLATKAEAWMSKKNNNNPEQKKTLNA